ncbi:hypothetical protein P8822_00335 [Bacillus sonorensis]|uniref:hypothetical protein n=1 Tax=Bacillus sonorensis TaxID=119858 RepID=UPI002DB6007C|nr:hypothetical protein [Bacillus sonorensis]MEC0526260.1 hypothetical protein [Bacillus sonorensis]
MFYFEVTAESLPPLKGKIDHKDKAELKKELKEIYSIDLNVKPDTLRIFIKEVSESNTEL